MPRRLPLIFSLMLVLLAPTVAPPTQAAGPALQATYTSGWRAIEPSTVTVLSHNLGGDDPGLYAVDLMMLDERPLGRGVHRRAYGGMLALENRIGMHWQGLTTSQIGINRAPEDAMSGQFLLRMWQSSSPQYDSGWVEVPAGGSLALYHNLGGDPANYAASLKFRNPTGGMGINHYALGGMGSEGWIIGGAYVHLDAERVVLTRNSDDEQAAEMRLLLYAEPPGGAPAYDSGWVDLEHNTVQNLTHGLDAAPSRLFVRWTQRSATHGINCRAVGGMELDRHYYGAGWQNLTDNAISLFRLAHDPYAEQVRIRIWRYDEPCVPALVSPAAGAEMDNGCGAGSNASVWPFSWTACPGATAYHLYVIGPTATAPAIDLDDLSTTSYTDTTYATVPDANRIGWHWRVRAKVDGVWGAWSAERTFDVEPLNTDCPTHMVYVPMAQSE